METEIDIPLYKNPKNENRWTHLLKKRVPILSWAPQYTRLAALGDLVAGVTLGLTLVPQSIAYANLAELPVQYGLYSAFMGTILYVFLGTVKEVSIGPTSLMALLTLQTCRGLPIEYVILLTFLSGCVVLVMGLLRLGFLVELISVSVTSGFTTATAIIIVVSQLKGVLGLSFTAESVVDNLRQIGERWHQVRGGDCALAAVCCTVLLALRKLKDVKVQSKSLGKALWLVSIGRNALVVLAASVFAYCTYDPDHLLIKLSGRVEPGFPTVSLPPFSVQVGNETVAFPEMVKRLGPTLIMMPIVMVIANIAIAKAFTAGERVDATQEMVTLGLVNCCGAVVRAMPTCGAFTRSAVAHASGVLSPAAGLYSGIITLLALVFMTEYFFFIPKACLSSVLICAVIFMVDYSTVIRLWKQSKSELVVLAVTFLVSVAVTVELGVAAGVAADLALLLYSIMHAQVHASVLKTEQGEAVRLQPTVGLVYANVERAVSCGVRAAAGRAPAPLLLDCGQLQLLDVAAEQALEGLSKKLQSSNQQLIPYNASSTLARRLAPLRLETRALRAGSAAAALQAVGSCPEPAETAALLLNTTDPKA